MYDGIMDAYPDILMIGKLIGDPARAAMLVALLDGRARPASELAWLAQVSRQAASAHLSKLEEGGLVEVSSEGRYRYYRLKNAEVGQALETLARIAPPATIRSLRTSEELAALRFARICYDHMAGYVGVHLTQAFLAKRWLLDQGQNYDITETGSQGFEDLGISVEMARRTRRAFAYPCRDWSENQPHLAGALGAALFKLLCDRGWVDRAYANRTVQLTDTGRHELSLRLEIDLDQPGRAGNLLTP